MFSVSTVGFFMYKEVTSNYTIISSSLNANTPNVVGKFSRILGVIIFIFNINFQNISYVFVKIVS